MPLNFHRGHVMSNNTHNMTLQNNLDALARFRPQLFRQIEERLPGLDVNIEHSAQGGVLSFPGSDRPSILAYKEDPWAEGKSFLAKVEPESASLVVVIGMGLGYAPFLLHKERPYLGKLVVVEPSLLLFYAGLHVLDLSALIQSDNVEIFVENIDLALFEDRIYRVASIEDSHIFRHVPSMRWDLATYGPLSDALYMVVNKLNASGGTTSQCGPRFFNNRLANFSSLGHGYSLDCLAEKFKGKPAVLVAAGPSLDQSLGDLKKVAGQCVVIAADSALAPLMRAGIEPDFVTTIDFQDVNLEKLVPFLGEEKWPFSLVSTIKSSPLVIKRCPARHQFFAFTEDQPQTWLHEALGIRLLVPPVASVAHLSLGVALALGVDPIFFVGQDLSFTDRNSDHAAGTVFSKNMPENSHEIETFQVQGIHGTKVLTDRQLMSLQQIFEEILAQVPRTYYNASAAGVHLKGTQAVQLSDFIGKTFVEEVPVQQMVDELVRLNKTIEVGAVRPVIEHYLTICKKLDGRISRGRKLGQKILQTLEALRNGSGQIDGFSRFPKKLQKQLVEYDGLNREIDAEQKLWDFLAELTFASLSDNDEMRRKNDQVKQNEGYLPWLIAELQRIDFVNQERHGACVLCKKSFERLLFFWSQERKMQAQAAKSQQEGPHLALASLYLEFGNFVQAQAVMAVLKSDGQQSPDYSLLMGELCAGRMAFEEARAHWQLALKTGGDAVASRIQQAKEREAAIWSRVIRESEKHPPYIRSILFARIAALLGSSAFPPEDVRSLWEAHLQAIRRMVDAEKFASGQRALQLMEDIGGQFPEIYMLQGRCWAGIGDIEKAIPIMEKAVQQCPTNDGWLIALVRVLLKAERFEAALDYLNKAVALKSEHAVVWEELGDQLFGCHDWEGAAIAYEHCFRYLPGHVSALVKLGDCFHEQGYDEAALAAYGKVLEMRPDDLDAQQRIGRFEQPNS